MDQIVNNLRNTYQSQITKRYEFRLRSLLTLKKGLKKYEEEFIEALSADLGKSAFESYETEIGILYKEIDEACMNLKKWMKPTRVHTPLMLLPASSTIYHDPLGVVLIMSPWNYPLQLSIAPLIPCIAAGNCALIKPSSYSLHTSALIKKMIDEIFDRNYIACVEGGRAVNEAVLKLNFDHIFFTGSVHVGKVVMKAASEHLTPVTLELGGKSPCIVDQHVHMHLAAKRIIWGKCLNAGQTCVCPDTLYVHESIKEDFIQCLLNAMKKMYPQGTLHSQEFGKIINDHHFSRLSAMLSDGHIITGGHVDAINNKIECTIMDQIKPDSQLLTDEIFGPILPIISWSDEEDLITKLEVHEHPLACYIFSTSTSFQKRILNRFNFGGGCINTTILHLSNSHLGFGGIKQSGMGQYHGYHGFKRLSHEKSILAKSRFEIPVQYPPYRNKMKWLKLFMK